MYAEMPILLPPYLGLPVCPELSASPVIPLSTALQLCKKTKTNITTFDVESKISINTHVQSCTVL